MKRFLSIILATILTSTLHASEPFLLEDQAQEWLNTYAINKETGKFSLSLEETELLANAIFYSYKLIKLDELTHACNRITTYFYKVLPEALSQEHQVTIGASTAAAFASLITHGKEDLQAAFVQATQQFEATLVALEQAEVQNLVNAYNAIKQNAYTSVEAWTKEEGVQLSQAAFAELSEEQSKNLFSFTLKFDTPHEQVVQMLADIPLKNLESFFAFQTEAHDFIKSIWQTHLITLITNAESAGFKEIKLLTHAAIAENKENKPE